MSYLFQFTIVVDLRHHQSTFIVNQLKFDEENSTDFSVFHKVQKFMIGYGMLDQTLPFLLNFSLSQCDALWGKGKTMQYLRKIS